MEDNFRKLIDFYMKDAGRAYESMDLSKLILKSSQIPYFLRLAYFWIENISIDESSSEEDDDIENSSDEEAEFEAVEIENADSQQKKSVKNDEYEDEYYKECEDAGEEENKEDSKVLEKNKKKVKSSRKPDKSKKDKNQADNDIKKIVLMHTCIPEEIIYSLGAVPIWALAGSFSAASYADQFVPRDTDPIIKSQYGLLLSEEFINKINPDLIICPLVSDTMRKIAYMLRENYEVLPLDIPPVKDSYNSLKKWFVQVKFIIEKVSDITGISLSKTQLRRVSSEIANAKLEAQRFIELNKRYPGVLTNSIKYLILNTYYMADDIYEWSEQLKTLNDEIEEYVESNMDFLKKERLKPNLLIIGSPIYFPNFKVPNLLDECGLNMYSVEFEMVKNFETIPDIHKVKTLNSLINTISKEYYIKDTSTAYVSSDTKMKDLMDIIENSHIDGILFHVVRGQVAIDFELDEIEEAASKKDIPIIRLETDYNYQDVEQLRIRLEAFSEIIREKKKQFFKSVSKENDLNEFDLKMQKKESIVPQKRLSV